MNKIPSNAEYAESVGYEIVAEDKMQTSAGHLPNGGVLRWALMQDKSGHRFHRFRVLWSFGKGEPEMVLTKGLTNDQRQEIVNEVKWGRSKAGRNHAYVMWKNEASRRQRIDAIRHRLDKPEDLFDDAEVC